MIKHKQLFRHLPDEGIFGDCYRTTLACLLGFLPEQVPHEHREMTWGEAEAFYDGWLHERKIRRIRTAFQVATVADALIAAQACSDGLPHIFSGTSRTGCNHAVIAQNGEIIHDPSLTEAGIVGPCDNGFFFVEWLVRPAGPAGWVP